MASVGRKALVKVSGAAVAFTAEACTTVTANTVYQITNTAMRVWDRTATITVLKDAVAQASTLYTINRLTGTITFGADQGAGVITVTGSYLPLSTAAEGKSYSYSVAKQNLADTEFGDTHVTRVGVLKDSSGSIGRWKSASAYFTDALTAGNPIVIEFYSDSSSAFDLKMWAILDKDGISSVVDGLVEEEVTFVGTTDADGRQISN